MATQANYNRKNLYFLFIDISVTKSIKIEDDLLLRKPDCITDARGPQVSVLCCQLKCFGTNDSCDWTKRSHIGQNIWPILYIMKRLKYLNNKSSFFFFCHDHIFRFIKCHISDCVNYEWLMWTWDENPALAKVIQQESLCIYWSIAFSNAIMNPADVLHVNVQVSLLGEWCRSAIFNTCT